MMRNFFFYGSFVAVGHFTVAVWHLFILSRLNPMLGAGLVLFIVTMNLLPFLGLIVLRTSSRLLAGWFFLIPFGIALAVGGYAHFLRSGSDNVFRMASSPWRPSYRVSAALLASLEIVGCWVGIRMLSLQEAVNS